MNIKKSELQNEIEALKEQLQDLTKTVNIQQEKIKTLESIQADVSTVFAQVKETLTAYFR